MIRTRTGEEPTSPIEPDLLTVLSIYELPPPRPSFAFSPGVSNLFRNALLTLEDSLRSTLLSCKAVETESGSSVFPSIISIWPAFLAQSPRTVQAYVYCSGF